MDTRLGASAGPSTPEASALLQEEWLEFEEAVLAPAVAQSQSSVDLEPAFSRLDKALHSSPYLTGQQLSTADVAVFVNLLALDQVLTLCASILMLALRLTESLTVSNKF